MLTSRGLPSDSTCVLKAEPGKLDNKRREPGILFISLPIVQAFRFMVGPGHCPMILKYGPSLSKAVGPVDPSFLVVKNLTLIKIFILQ